jgi:hypothetical protein
MGRRNAGGPQIGANAPSRWRPPHPRRFPPRRSLRHAHPSAGDALVPERGARGATGDPRLPPDFSQIGASAPSRWRPPHLQEPRPGDPSVMPIPALEMRSSLSAKPKGRREIPACRQTYPQIGARAPSRWRPPHLQGSPPRRSLRHAHPSAGDALVPERGARGATGDSRLPPDFSQIGASAPLRWRSPHLQGFCRARPSTGDAPVPEARDRDRPQGDGEPSHGFGNPPVDGVHSSANAAAARACGTPTSAAPTGSRLPQHRGQHETATHTCAPQSRRSPRTSRESPRTGGQVRAVQLPERRGATTLRALPYPPPRNAGDAQNSHQSAQRLNSTSIMPRLRSG